MKPQRSLAFLVYAGSLLAAGCTEGDDPAAKPPTDMSSPEGMALRLDVDSDGSSDLFAVEEGGVVRFYRVVGDEAVELEDEVGGVVAVELDAATTITCAGGDVFRVVHKFIDQAGNEVTQVRASRLDVTAGVAHWAPLPSHHLQGRVETPVVGTGCETSS